MPTYHIHSDLRLAIFSVALLRTRASSDSVRFEWFRKAVRGDQIIRQNRGHAAWSRSGHASRTVHIRVMAERFADRWQDGRSPQTCVGLAPLTWTTIVNKLKDERGRLKLSLGPTVSPVLRIHGHRSGAGGSKSSFKLQTRSTRK